MKDELKIRGQLKGYLAWPLLLSLFVITGNVAVMLVSRLAAAVMLPFTLCYVALAAWIFWYRRGRMLGGLVEFSAEYAWVQKQLLAEMRLPYALADEDGRILWMNEAFQQVLAGEKSGRKNLLALFPEVTKTDLAVDDETVRVHTSYGGSKYRLDLHPSYVSSTEEEDKEAIVEKQKILAVYLFDETEILHYHGKITS